MRRASRSITRILAAVALVAPGFTASSCGTKESDVYGSWRATRHTEVQTLELHQDHTYRFAVESDRTDDVITMTGTWSWIGIDGGRVDLQDCDVREVGGERPPGFTYESCHYSLESDGFVVGPEILAGWDGAPNLRKLTP